MENMTEFNSILKAGHIPCGKNLVNNMYVMISKRKVRTATLLGCEYCGKRQHTQTLVGAYLEKKMSCLVRLHR
jgi:hypothetical protein